MSNARGMPGGGGMLKLRFDRYISNKASNVACRAELGRLALNITINQKILNYILYIKSKHKESFVKQFF